MEMPASNLEERRKTIVLLHQEGHSRRDIARILNISRATVDLWIQRYTDEGDLTDRRRYNHGVLQLTGEQRTQMRQHYEQYPFTPTKYFADQFNVSQETIRKHLHSMGLHHRR